MADTFPTASVGGKADLGGVALWGLLGRNSNPHPCRKKKEGEEKGLVLVEEFCLALEEGVRRGGG